MNKILLIIILTLLSSCKSEKLDKEKLEQKINANINIYLNKLGNKTGVSINNILVTKIDTVSTYREMKILNNALIEEFSKVYDEKAQICNELDKIEYSLKLHKSINGNGDYQSGVNSDIIKRNYLKEQFDKLNVEVWSINSQAKSLKDRSVKANKKDFKSLIAYVEYKIKYNDSSTQQIKNFIFLNKDGEVYKDEIYIYNLKKTYLNKIESCL